MTVTLFPTITPGVVTVSSTEKVSSPSNTILSMIRTSIHSVVLLVELTGNSKDTEDELDPAEETNPDYIT